MYVGTLSKRTLQLKLYNALLQTRVTRTYMVGSAHNGHTFSPHLPTPHCRIGTRSWPDTGSLFGLCSDHGKPRPASRALRDRRTAGCCIPAVRTRQIPLYSSRTDAGRSGRQGKSAHCHTHPDTQRSTVDRDLPRARPLYPLTHTQRAGPDHEKCYAHERCHLLAHTGPQVREPVTVSDLEQDLDTFIELFIADYRAANAGIHHSNSDGIPTVSQTDLPPSVSVTGEPEKTYPDAGLTELRADQFRISISGGRFTQALTTRALQQFSDAGYPLKPSHGQDNRITLGMELTQRTLEDRCPGKVLYESGLYLVEQVQLARNRRVSIWSDTWLRETTQVVTPRSQQQLESDQDALLQQFIDSLRSH